CARAFLCLLVYNSCNSVPSAETATRRSSWSGLRGGNNALYVDPVSRSGSRRLRVLDRRPKEGWMTTEAPTTDNGVNVQALLDARTALVDAPEGAQFTWRASNEWVRGTHSQTGINNFFGLGGEQSHRTSWSFEADHPEIFASEDNGVTPVEYVLVGLSSCLTAGVAAVAQNRGIQLNSVKATIEGDMDILGILGGDPETRNGFNEIRVRYEIDADASPEEIEALVAQSQKRSAVFDVVTNPTNVTVQVN